MTGTRPVSTFGDLPRSMKVSRWGSAWMKASMEWYDRTANIGFGGDCDVTRYQSTHLQGGTIMSNSPDRGVVNLHQQHWDISNLFVIGTSTFPNAAPPIPRRQSSPSLTAPPRRSWTSI